MQAQETKVNIMDCLNMPVDKYNERELRRIAAYTQRLEQIPLEEFRTSAEVRRQFLGLIEVARRDFEWIVEEIHSCHFSLAEIKHLKLNAEEYNPQYEEFIVQGKAALARFAACFPAIKDIVLDGTHKEIDELKMEYAKGDAADVMEALEADLTPRPYFV